MGDSPFKYLRYSATGEPVLSSVPASLVRGAWIMVMNADLRIVDGDQHRRFAATTRSATGQRRVLLLRDVPDHPEIIPVRVHSTSPYVEKLSVPHVRHDDAKTNPSCCCSNIPHGHECRVSTNRIQVTHSAALAGIHCCDEPADSHVWTLQ